MKYCVASPVGVIHMSWHVSTILCINSCLSFLFSVVARPVSVLCREQRNPSTHHATVAGPYGATR